MYWVRKYLSVEYKDMNCSKFVEYVLRDHFKKDYSFPQSEGTVFAQSAQIKANVPMFCEKTESPKEGDLVLMHGIRRLCHVGMYLESNGIQYVLHCEKNMGCSAVHRAKDLIRYGYSIEGFYTWVK